MGRFTELLKTMRPRNGRLVLEDGTSLNRGDALRAQPDIASREGYAYRAFWSGTIPALTTYYFQIDVPSGYDLFGFTRTSLVRLDRINNTFVVGGTPGATQETMDGFLFDERGGTVTSQSSLLRVASLSGQSERTPPIPITPDNTGPIIARKTSAQTEGGFQPAFNSTYKPGFVYENPTGGDAELYLLLTWQELPSL